MKLTFLPITLFLLFSSSALGRPQSQQEPTLELPPDLARVLTDYEAAWRKGDSEALSLLFAEDGYVLEPGRPPTHGRSAIRKIYTGPGSPLALRAIAFAKEEKVAYIIGCYAKHVGEADIGKFTLTLKRASYGRWLILSDMDNSNRPHGEP
jgi:ketosteroid isomerase-like protein